MQKEFIKIIFVLVYLQVLSGSILAQEPLAEVIFSKERGLYTENFELVISTNISDASIRYTIDGSNPLTSLTASLAIAPVTLTIDPTNLNGRDRAPGFIVRAVVEQNVSIVSKVITHSYFFPAIIGLLSADGQKPGPGWPNVNSNDNSKQYFNYGMDPDILTDSRYQGKISAALQSIPTISLVTDIDNLFDPDSGIYVNAQYHGIAWERPASVELIKPGNNEGFQIDAGIRIRGGWSRHNNNPKHAFRLFFRTEYGEGKLDYPLFGDEGDDEFNKLDLRTSQNYSWSFYGDYLNTMNRDVFSRDVQRDMGKPYTRSRYYHLYLNGTYWGLFQSQERAEASYAEQYFGGQKEDYDVVKINIGDNWDVYNIEATDGNLDAWRRLWEFAKQGFETDEAYYKVQGLNPDGSINPVYEKLVDIDNLIDYMLCTFIVGDFDGPVSSFRGNAGANNFYGIYNRNNPDGFKFLRHDAEHSLTDNPWGLDRTGPFPAGETFDQFNPQWLHQQLEVHPEYRLHLADKIYKYFFNDGVLTPEANIKRFLSRKNEIDIAIIAESARWGDSKISQPRTRDDDWLPAINHIVDNFFPERTQIVLSQLINKGWYPEIDIPQFSSSSGIVSSGFNLNMLSTQGSIYYTTDGTDPHIPYSTDGSNSRFLVTHQDNKRIIVPLQSIVDSWKSDINFDDSAWNFSNGNPGGIGYEKDTGYENYISYDPSNEMFNDGSNPNINTSCYIRIPFIVNGEELVEYNFLKMKIRYDDGFVAYLNGVEIARVNAPLPLLWDSQASQNHEADAVESFDISEHLSDLNAGDNLLAIHGLNVSNTSSDFLILTELVAGNNSAGAVISPNAKLYTEPITILKNSSIKARVLKENKWGALSELDLWVDDELNYLVITEIHYHPLDADTINDRELEFIELKNTGSKAIDLSEHFFSRGINYSFSPGTQIDAGELVVLASNDVEFEKRYGFAPFAEYTGQLNNGGEVIALNSSVSDTLIKIDYNDNYPWPNSADGLGYALVVKEEDPTRDYNNSENWRASTSIHGSPGDEDVTSIKVAENKPVKPISYQLNQNYPNPFNGYTKIEYTLPKNSKVKIKIVNIVGQTIRTLVNQNQSSGFKAVVWDGRNESGHEVSSGIYIYSLIINNNFLKAKRMLFIK